jgi:hypothetical protein
MNEVALTPMALRQMLSQQCEMAGSRTEWARRHRIPASVVSDTINGKRSASDAVVNALGFVRVDRYVPMRRGGNSPLVASTGQAVPA